jgi:hypothetical protein
MKWEYQISDWGIQIATESLNERGLEGWEVIAVQAIAQNLLRFVMKREIESENLLKV